MENIVELKNVSYSYPGSIAALKNINLTVGKGEMFSVIGQNGSGKSTLLHIINALILPDTGEYFFNGNKITEKSLHDKNISLNLRSTMSYIFQNPEMQLFCPTVIDELLFAPLQMNISKESASDRAEKTLEYLDIQYLRDRPVYKLSGGEKKKVAIASSLTLNPDIILIDEPLAGLDPKAQTFIIELLFELNKAGKTIIFTTHHLDLIDHLQPRVAVLSEEHTIKKTATAQQILTDEEFLVSVNLIHEHTHKHGEEIHKHTHAHYVFHRH